MPRRGVLPGTALAPRRHRRRAGRARARARADARLVVAGVRGRPAVLLASRVGGVWPSCRWKANYPVILLPSL
jgi:hypothetical protein